MTTPRIVDAVFAREPRPRGRWWVIALGLGLGMHGAVAFWGAMSSPSLESWSAELATRVHAELTREQVVDLPPPPPDKPPPSPPPESTRTEPRPTARARRSPAPHGPPPPPAQAGRILAADPAAAVDLPGTTFVTGSASTYAGGVTSSTGTNRAAVTGPVATAPSPPSRRASNQPRNDLSSPVALDETDWDCGWPREADSQSVDEQSVVIQVMVRADGSAESVKTLSDPGYGFAGAARACAMNTLFSPAHDQDGHPIRSESPPIRVHFTR